MTQFTVEYDYDEFLEKKFQILILLNLIDEVFDIRDSLLMRINALEQIQRKKYVRHKKHLNL